VVDDSDIDEGFKLEVGAVPKVDDQWPKLVNPGCQGDALRGNGHRVDEGREFAMKRL